MVKKRKAAEHVTAQEQKENATPRTYQTPASYVAAFYGLLVLWTIATVPLIWKRFSQGVFREDWLYACMIGFFYLFTWFWSLGLFYIITLEADGRIRMKGLRRTLEVSIQQIDTIQGSKFSGGFGFMRFKLPRESVYLFCHRRENSIDNILREIRRINPMVKMVRL